MTDLRLETEVDVLISEKLSMQERSDEMDNLPQNLESLDEGTQAILEVEQDIIRPEVVEAAGVNNRSLFFVDTNPSLDDKGSSGPSYESVSAAPLGTSVSQHSEEEIIVFMPRVYRQPQPISTPHPVASSSPIKSSTLVLPTTEQMPRLKVPNDPRALQRKEKPSLKSDSRGRKKKKRRQRVMEGSDIEWGSDGPPGIIIGVEGEDVDDGSDVRREAGEDCMAVLRDYLEGTILNAKSERKEREEENGNEKDRETSGNIAKELNTYLKQGGEQEEEPLGKLVGKQDRMGEEGDEDSEGDWESSSDSRGPPDLVDIKSALEPVATESEEEVKEVAGPLAGGDSLGETDWFIRNMEVNSLAFSVIITLLMR